MLILTNFTVLTRASIDLCKRTCFSIHIPYLLTHVLLNNNETYSSMKWICHIALIYWIIFSKMNLVETTRQFDYRFFIIEIELSLKFSLKIDKIGFWKKEKKKKYFFQDRRIFLNTIPNPMRREKKKCSRVQDKKKFARRINNSSPRTYLRILSSLAAAFTPAR